MKQAKIPEHPGVILKERFLDRLGISPTDLAEGLGVSRRRLSDLIRGRRRLSPDMAHRLGRYFQVPPLWFLEMQARFDARDEILSKSLQERVRPIEEPEDFIITPGGALPLSRSNGAPPEPMSVHVSDQLLERLRAQAALSPPRNLVRRPKVITLPDGTPILTGE